MAVAVEEREIYLSVVIPTFNEQARIADTLVRVKEFLRESGWPAEVLVVDDGSSDATLEVVKAVDRGAGTAQPPTILLATPGPANHGKGRAVQIGLASAQGRFVVFTDADLSTPIEEVSKLLRALEDGADLAIGSRRLPTSDIEPQPSARRVMGWIFGWLVRLLAVPGVRDSQCGFKCYRRHAAQRLSELQRIPGFSFDVEHLYLARRLGYRVVEVGVRWADSPGTKIKPWRDSWRMLRDLFRIRSLHRHLS